MASKDFITCHVLDTTIGKPGKGIKVELCSPDPQISKLIGTVHATTNDDGRIANWSSSDGKAVRLDDAVRQNSSNSTSSPGPAWTMKFYIEDYYGSGKCFFPVVDLNFRTDAAQSHFHVPLLLGPYSYTTYRGS